MTGIRSGLRTGMYEGLKRNILGLFLGGVLDADFVSALMREKGWVVAYL